VLRLAIAAVAAVLVAALVALQLWLPGYVRSDAVQRQLEAAAESALTREVAWQKLDVWVLPPSLDVLGARVAGEAPGAPDWLTADEISLRVALLPLLAGSVVIDSLRIEAPELRLARTPDGLALPGPRRSEAGATAAPHAGEGGGFALAVREIELRDARLHFEDRTLEPPAGFSLEDVDLTLRASSFHRRFDVTGSVTAPDGGSLAAHGTAALDGALDLEARLDRFGLAPARPFLAEAMQLEGLVTGTLAIRGPVAAPEELRFDLRVDRGALVIEEIEVRGTAALSGQLSGAWAAPTGEFRIDATEAELRYGGVFSKPPGMPAHVEGRLVRGEGGRLSVDDVRLRIQRAELRGRIDLGPSPQLAVSSEPIQLEDWQPLVAGLVKEVSGPAQFQDVRLQVDPIRIFGRVALMGVRARLGAGEGFGLRGDVDADGGSIRSRDLVAEIGGQEIPVQAEVQGVGGAWQTRVTAAAEQVETAQLLAALGGPADRLEGPLEFDADLAGSLAGERALTQLGGGLRFAIRPGRLRGVSILQATLEALDRAQSGLLRPVGLSGATRPLAPSLRSHYGDRFESMSATLTLEGGLAKTRDFLLVAPGYEFRMRGVIRLADLGLDAEGEIALGEGLTASVLGLAGARQRRGPGMVIAIPRLEGTLTDPKPTVDASVFWRSLLGTAESVGQGVEDVVRGLGGLVPGR
jgi:hypothetical protein